MKVILDTNVFIMTLLLTACQNLIAKLFGQQSVGFENEIPDVC